MSFQFQQSEFKPQEYNCLEDVIDVDATVKLSGLKAQFLRKAADVFRKYRVNCWLGITLLHRHNEVYDGELMIEQEFSEGEQEALVTKPISPDECTTRFVPALWKINDESVSPLEFSNDPTAIRIYDEMNIPADFLHEYFCLINEFEFGKYFGLGIVERKFYDKAVDDNQPIEVTRSKERANVVILDRIYDDEVPITTAWSIPDPAPTIALNCYPQVGCKTELKCKKFCRDYGSDPHHEAHKPKESHKTFHWHSGPHP